MNQAQPSESYIARLDYLAFNGKVCSSVAYSDEQLLTGPCGGYPAPPPVQQGTCQT